MSPDLDVDTDVVGALRADLDAIAVRLAQLRTELAAALSSLDAAIGDDLGGQRFREAGQPGWAALAGAVAVGDDRLTQQRSAIGVALATLLDTDESAAAALMLPRDGQ